MGEIRSVTSAFNNLTLILSQDHVLFGPTYNTILITDSALSQPVYLDEAMQLFASEQSGLLSNPGSDFLGLKSISNVL